MNSLNGYLFELLNYQCKVDIICMVQRGNQTPKKKVIKLRFRGTLDEIHNTIPFYHL